VKDIKYSFDLFDHQGSGKIVPKEMIEAFEQLIDFQERPLSVLTFQVLHQLNKEHEKELGFEAFIDEITARITPTSTRKQTDKVFQLFD